MRAYPDTSFLCTLYRLQANSPLAAAYFAAMPGALEVTTLLLYEFRQAVRFQIRLQRHDPTKGYSQAEGTKMLADLKSDLISGAVTTIPAPWPQIHLAAERLSELYTDASGHRSMDILHVATAIELGVKVFLTFDGNQKKLAEAEGLIVPV
ncbi:MAG: PIN domain-containing protein [Verrucomicrobiaceae bacterium]|jgi:predicted nucleic acid-binding protein|nr:PIN domain-containing protein [Verrucomicrobiaceae bacterium]